MNFREVPKLAEAVGEDLCKLVVDAFMLEGFTRVLLEVVVFFLWCIGSGSIGSQNADIDSFSLER